MPELTLKLKIDPVTGKKTVVVDYESDVDALPDEHEEEHRLLVRKLLDGTPVESSDVVVERENEPAAAAEESPEESKGEGTPQKA